MQPARGPGMAGRRIDRRRLLRIGGAGVVGAVVSGRTGDRQLAAQTPQATPGGNRIIEHALGTTELTGTPTRIVAVTGQMDLDTLLALDYPPVAAGYNAGDNDSRFIEYQQNAIDQLGVDVEGFRFRPEPDVELIISYEPDLVLGHQGWLEPVYDQLSSAVPTVVSYNDDAMWAENIRHISACIGRDDALDEFVAEIDEQTARTREAMADRAGTTVAFMGIYDNEFWVSNDLTYTVETMEAVGLATPQELVTEPGADPSADYQNVYSLETIGALGEADVWVVAEAQWETVHDQPTVRSLPVVARGNVVTISEDEQSVWYYPTVLTMRRLLELLPQRIPVV